MKLYIGGAYQGQEELAARENPGAELILNFHEQIRDLITADGDAVAFTDALIRERPGAVVVSNEVGSGVVPMEKSDRAFREAVGRALCRIAQSAESVTRVTCGIGIRIK